MHETHIITILLGFHLSVDLQRCLVTFCLLTTDWSGIFARHVYKNIPATVELAFFAHTVMALVGLGQAKACLRGDG